MAVRIGHASLSETGGVNGAKGDQTGREVRTQAWYSRPWDFMAIHPSAEVREKHAKAVEAACANDKIGYGQNDRNTLNSLAKAVGYDLSKVGLCNCDCSSLQNVAAVASGSGATYGANGWVTWTMEAELKKLGYKIVKGSFLASADYCVRGAIYVSTQHHTACGLDDGALYPATLSAAGVKLPGGFSVGQKVKVRSGAKDYTGKTLASWVPGSTFEVMEARGDRVVIGLRGVVTAAVRAEDLSEA